MCLARRARSGRRAVALHPQPAVDAVVHRLPDLVEPAVEIVRRPCARLVGPLHLGNGLAGARPSPASRPPCRRGWDSRPRPSRRAASRPPWASRASSPALQPSPRSRRRWSSRSPPCRGSRSVEGAQDHAVGVARQRRAVVEHQVLAGAKRSGGNPAASTMPVSRTGPPAPRRRSGSSVAGSKPHRPRITARSVAWPLPVKASEPCSEQVRCDRRSRAGLRSRPERRSTGTARPPSSAPWCGTTTGRRRS
jgi:hypothetical protein